MKDDPIITIRPQNMKILIGKKNRTTHDENINLQRNWTSIKMNRDDHENQKHTYMPFFNSSTDVTAAGQSVISFQAGRLLGGNGCKCTRWQFLPMDSHDAPDGWIQRFILVLFCIDGPSIRLYFKKII